MRLCDLDLSKELQELGYDGEYSAWIDTTDGSVQKDSTFLYDWHIPCPRLDDAAYWLMEKYGYVATVVPYYDSEKMEFLSEVHRYNQGRHRWQFICGVKGGRPYETALEIAVKEAITIIKMRFV